MYPGANSGGSRQPPGDSRAFALVQHVGRDAEQVLDRLGGLGHVLRIAAVQWAAEMESRRVALLLFAAVACATPPTAGPVAGEGYRGCVLEPLDSYRSELECDGVWLPSAADIAAAERGLTAFVAGEEPELARKLPSYYRQYLGIVRDGRRLIYINAMHQESLREDPDVDPTKGLIFVLDGGDWYFQLEYDVATRSYSEFGVNGVA